MRDAGLKTAPYFSVTSEDYFETAMLMCGAPSIFKTRRMGYDGKGQAKVASEDELAKAYAKFGAAPGILEGFVDFAFEASVIAARGQDGSFAAYDSPENAHENHILRRSTVPGRLTAAQNNAAKDIARRRRARLCRRVRGRAVRDEIDHCQNEIAPGAQLGPLDH